MIMKKPLIALFLFFAGIDIYAQGITMREVFTQMPDSMLPYLSRNNKLDLIDFIDSGMTAEVTNEFDDKTILEKLTDNYLYLKLSPASRIEMKLLPYANKTDSVNSVICALTSFGEEAVESSIKFYTPQWLPIDIENPLHTRYSGLIERPDTMNQERFAVLRRMISPLMLVATFSPEEDKVEIKVSTIMLSAEDKKSIYPLLRSKNLKWDGTSFK